MKTKPKVTIRDKVKAFHVGMDYLANHTTTCCHCRRFFAQFRCAAATHGECDCPKCQGYCECGYALRPR